MNTTGERGLKTWQEVMSPLRDLMEKDPDAFLARMKASLEVKWKRVIGPEDCTADEEGTLICPVCGIAYEFCSCPAPNEPDMFEYRVTDGVSEARPTNGMDW